MEEANRAEPFLANEDELSPGALGHTPLPQMQFSHQYERSRTPSPQSYSPPPPQFPGSPAAEGATDWTQRLTRSLQPALRVLAGSRVASPPSVQRSSFSLPPSVGDSPLPSAARLSEGSPPSTGGRLGVHLTAQASTDSVVDPRRRTALLTWGLNSSGQLGFGDFATRILPRAVEYFKATKLAGVACGSRASFALDSEGKVFAWGKGEDGQLGIGERSTAMTPRLVESLLRQPIAQLKCRGAHVLALTARGQLWAWGRNEDGQLGYNKAAGGRPREHHHATPERVPALMGTRIVQIACGRGHSVAVDRDGRLYCWGGNDDGALGHGDRVSRPSPTLCAALYGLIVVEVACGSRHTLALVQEPASPLTGSGGSPPTSGTLYSWGWGVYGQLGHGDVGDRLEPTAVAALVETPVVQLACGYRHSMVVTADEPRVIYAWGWGIDGQLGTGAHKDANLPQPVTGLPVTGALQLRLGGRHSLALCEGGKVFAWGKDDDGQLGQGVQSRGVPTRVDALRSSSVGFEVLDADCGWAHTALLVAYALPVDAGRGVRKASDMLRRQPSTVGDAQARKYNRLFASGDFEGLFGQVLGTSIQYMLMQRVLLSTCGMSAATLNGVLLPGATAMYVFGHLFFAAQATLLSRRTRQPATALPQGCNIVTFVAWTNLIMGPVYRAALTHGVSAADAARRSYDAGLCACLLLGGLELVGVLFVETLRQAIPRAAMLSAIAGVSLTFMAMGFAVQIYAAPATAIVSMLLMLLFYAGQVKLPLKVPGGVLAVAVGWALAALSGEMGLQWFVPGGEGLGSFAPELALPTFRVGFLRTFADGEFWGCLSVVIPMWMVTLVNNLSNIQSAATVGDEYSPRQCLLGCALINIVCVFLGNPFPSCVYIGHPAFKAMGCRVGYLYMNILPTIFFGCFQGAGLLQQLVPIESGVSFLLWVG